MNKTRKLLNIINRLITKHELWIINFIVTNPYHNDDNPLRSIIIRIPRNRSEEIMKEIVKIIEREKKDQVDSTGSAEWSYCSLYGVAIDWLIENGWYVAHQSELIDIES